MDIFTKQPVDIIDIDVDMSEFLPDSDNISGATASIQVAPDAELVLGTRSVNTLTKVVKQWISGGTSGVTYQVAVTITSNEGRTKQVDFKVKVKEI